MSKIKSFSVQTGDMFYIEHETDSLTIIDCNIVSEKEDTILNELKSIQKTKSVTRFISTHPDEDHIHGIELVDKNLNINNFYCVENKINKKNGSASFQRYCELRDGKHHFYLCEGVERPYLNKSGKTNNGKMINSSNISILWPKTNQEDFKKALEEAERDNKYNNICPIIKFSADNGASFLWFGDLEKSFMNKIENELCKLLTHVDIVFAPHHGRQTGAIPGSILERLSPKVIVIGEASSNELDYYSNYNHINQNSLKDILFVTSSDGIDIYALNKHNYDFLRDLKKFDTGGLKYIGTVNMNIHK